MKKSFSYFDRPPLDPAAARRDYLLAKRTVYASIPISVAVTLAVLGGCGVIINGLRTEREEKEVATAILMLCLPAAAIIAYIGWRSVRRKVAEIAAMPYVPPGHEQIAALPAEEVLVRGSDAPVAGSEELVKAVVAGKDEDNAGLLRGAGE